ncbi:MAG: hypothetical protein DHS20C11_31850 [Lysobacteraceae bacterium]|nr:MAG: hypothetical protein DHS20C11_31850 [Xanthomonadaceae bacterium]
MSQLYHNGQWTNDPWLHLDSVDDLVDQLDSGTDRRFLRPATLPLHHVGRALAIAPLPAPKIGARIAPDTAITQVAPFLPLLGLVVLEVDRFEDGRVFTQARDLRSVGFAEEIRVRGPIVADQIGALLACSVDSIDFTQQGFSKPPSQVTHPFSVRYQPGLGYGFDIRAARRNQLRNKENMS